MNEHVHDKCWQVTWPLAKQCPASTLRLKIYASRRGRCVEGPAGSPGRQLRSGLTIVGCSRRGSDRGLPWQTAAGQVLPAWRLGFQCCETDLSEADSQCQTIWKIVKLLSCYITRYYRYVASSAETLSCELAKALHIRNNGAGNKRLLDIKQFAATLRAHPYRRFCKSKVRKWGVENMPFLLAYFMDEP